MRGTLLVLMSIGCAFQRAPAWERPGLPFGALSAEIIDDLIKKGDAAFAGREDPGMLNDALDNWRAALRYRPDDVPLLVRLSNASRVRARLLSGADADKQANAAIVYAERALATRNAALLERALDRKRPPRDVFAPAMEADLPALSAYAQALLEWCEWHGSATLLLHRDWIVGAAKRAAELDRGFDFGAPERILGIMAAALTPDLGGDYHASQEHFEAALAAAPAYLPTRLEYALRYAVRMRDGARYRQLLQEAADGDAEAIPAVAPENRAAKKRAKDLIAEARSW